jgi:hypothetical protein
MGHNLWKEIVRCAVTVVFIHTERYGSKVQYFSIDNAHLMYNAHPKLFRHSFLCIDNAHDAN